jgi:hypothetical protein
MTEVVFSLNHNAKALFWLHQQVTLNSQIWDQFCQWNGIRVPPYTLETTCQCLKHIVVSTSNMTIWYFFHSTSDPDFPNLGPTWPVEWYKDAHICPWDSIPVAQTLLCIYNMDVWSDGLWWISASTMMICHYVHSTSDPEFPNLGPTWPVEWYKGAPICPWDSIPMAQTHCICLIWMFEVVWDGYQPHTWCNGIICIPQVTYRIDRGIRDASRQISFEFLFIKTRPPDTLHIGFVFIIQFRVGIRYVMCQGGEFW